MQALYIDTLTKKKSPLGSRARIEENPHTSSTQGEERQGLLCEVGDFV